MNKLTSLAAMLALAAVPVFAQDAAVTTEKKVKTESSVDGNKSTTTEKSSEVSASGATSTKTSVSSSYETRLESAYKAAAVADADIERLRAIDIKVRDARKAKDAAKVKEYYTEQTRILKPEQVTKVRTYLTENPAPATVPAYEMTTYEEVPTQTGIGINTPLGNVGIGVNTGSTVVEKKEVVPAP